MRAILSAGPDLDPADCDGKTALMWATEKNHPAIIDLLLTWGADLGKAAHNGRTPLAVALDRGYAEAAKLLGARE